jgi:hypothetical protein
MTPELWLIAGVLGGIVAGVVTFTLLNRQKPDAAVTDVDELAVEVERIGKAVRRLTMQRVRGAALDPELPVPPAQPVSPVAPVMPPSVKDQIRSRVFGGNR